MCNLDIKKKSRSSNLLLQSKMDEAVNRMIEEVKLPHLVHEFTTKKIDMDFLISLNEEELEQLLPNFKDRIIIQRYLRSVHVVKESDVNVSHGNLSTCSTIILEPGDSLEISEQDFSLLERGKAITEDALKTDPTINDGNQPNKVHIQSTPKRKREGFFMDFDDVEDFIKRNSKLLCIYNNYIEMKPEERRLENADRNRVSEALIDGLMERHYTVKATMLSDLADGIVKVFPTESKELYYCPKQGGAKTPRGKLYFRYNNEVTRRKRRNSHKKLDAPAADIQEISPEAQTAFNLLKYSHETWGEVETNWALSRSLRKVDLKKMQLAEFIEKWIILKNQRSFSLVSSHHCWLMSNAIIRDLF